MSGQDCDEAPLPSSYEVTAHLGLRYCVAISNTSRQIFGKAYLPVALRVRHEPRWPNYIIAVALRVARWVFQRHEHLARHAPALSNIVLDYGVATIEPVLVSQSVEDALCGMALLLRRAPVVFEYAVYDARVGLELGGDGVGASCGIREAPDATASCVRCLCAARTPGTLP